MVFDMSNPFASWTNPTVRSTKTRKPTNFKKTGAMGVGSMKQPDWYPTSAPQKAKAQKLANQKASNSRIKRASKNKVKMMEWSVNNDPTIGYANKLLSDLGKAPIKQIVTRRRRGRWSTKLSADPKTVIDDYNKQKTLIDWGKKVGGLALDPKRTVSIVDVFSQKAIPTYWTHNGRRRRTGTQYVNTSTYKDVLATSRPKGERWDMLEAKLTKEADAKKERYVKLYKPLDVDIKERLSKATGAEKTEIQNQLNYVRYSYYGIADKELAESEQYKSNLITGIRQTDAITDDMKKGINKNPDENKSEEEYKKMLLVQLEKEYDQEQKDFEQTAKEVQKRETVFAQSSSVQRPNRRIVQLASNKSTSVQRIQKPEMAQKWTTPKKEINDNIPSSAQRGTPSSAQRGTPSSAQRGQGFKRFQKW